MIMTDGCLKLARVPLSLVAALATLPWSLALPRARASYPSCVAVYPRDWNSFASQLTRRYPSRLCLLCRFPRKLHSRSRCVLCRWSLQLHSRAAKEFQSRKGISEIEGKAAR